MNLVKHSFFHHFPLLFLTAYAIPMIFLGLGDNVLQIDEGMDTFITTTILKFGFPMHSDGLNSSMLYADIYDGLFVYRTWVPYYAQALSISLLGQTTFAARLPFALIGVFAVIFFYRFALKFTGRQYIAFLAAFLGFFLSSPTLSFGIKCPDSVLIYLSVMYLGRSIVGSPFSLTQCLHLKDLNFLASLKQPHSGHHFSSLGIRDTAECMKCLL